MIPASILVHKMLLDNRVQRCRIKEVSLYVNATHLIVALMKLARLMYFTVPSMCTKTLVNIHYIVKPLLSGTDWNKRILSN